MRGVPFVFLLAFLASSLSACGGGGGTTDAGALPDAATDAGAPDLGATDADVDATVWPVCDLHGPSVAGTTETDALANAPAKCGMAPYTWLRDPMLGNVVSHTQTDRFLADGIVALATTAGVMVPRMPEHDVRVERVVYVTQDRGHLVQSTMALAYPSDITTRTDLPVLVFMHGTSGFTAGCGPTNDPDYRIFAGLFASYGWVVATPDYLGLESAGTPYGMVHPYLIGEPTAIASLDAARAAVQRIAGLRGPLCATSRVAFFGGSQGGHAALWVDRIAPYYARELEMLGGVATVPPADFLAEGQRALTMVVDATENVMASAAAQAPWYGRTDVIPTVFVAPWDHDVPAALTFDCTPSDVIGHTTALTDVFQPALLAAASAGTLADFPAYGCWSVENGLTTTSIARLPPTTPSASYGILWVLGENDELVSTPIERVSYDTLCAAGMPLQYLECAGARHVDTTFWSVPEIIEFLDARKAGTPFTPACTRAAASRCRGTPSTVP